METRKKQSNEVAKKERMKIVLVGKNERKHHFIRDAGGQPPTMHGVDFCYIGDEFMVWDLAGVDTHRTGLNYTARSYLRGAKVIIYLDPTEGQKEQWEALRNEEECIAIDFDKLNITPEQCFIEIPNLILEDQIAKRKAIVDKGALLINLQKHCHSPFSILPNELISIIGCSLFSKKTINNPLIKSVVQINADKKEKINLVYNAALSDKQSSFAALPIEVTNKIANAYWSDNSEKPVYGSFVYCKSIFTAIPPKLIAKPKQIENKKENNCSIQ